MFAFYFLIGPIFGKGFSSAEIELAKNLFILLFISLLTHVFENIFSGIITGFNEFSFSNGVKTIWLILRAASIYIVLAFIKSAVSLVLIDISLTVILLIIEIIYIKRKLGLRIKYTYWDKTLFVESIAYTALVFVQTIVNQLNGNAANVIIGALINPVAVTIYSIGLVFFNMYSQFAVSFSNLMLPTVTNKIAANASSFDLENVVIKVGRFQYAFLGAALAGFIVVGKEFIILWMGIDFAPAWIIGIILMAPALIHLVQNVCLSILRAKNKIGFRTITIAISSILGTILSFFLVKYFGYIYASVGFAVSFLLGEVLIMNLYYFKNMKLNIFRIFYEVFKKTTPCLIFATIAVLILNQFFSGTWLLLVIKIFAFLIVYGLSMFFYGFSKDEVKFIFGH